MNAPPNIRMNAQEFMAWNLAQPDGRFELERGRVVEMSAELLGHTRVKASVFMELQRAADASGCGCEVLMDGASVSIDDDTVRGPDISVQSGGVRDADSALELSAPLILVEVLSPSSERRDMVKKLEEYFRIPSVQHYLIVDPEGRIVVWHQRLADGGTKTRVASSGNIEISPPGLVVNTSRFFTRLSSM